jgi:hypothetical protein
VRRAELSGDQEREEGAGIAENKEETGGEAHRCARKWRREGGFGSYRRGVGVALEALARVVERRWQGRQ